MIMLAFFIKIRTKKAIFQEADKLYDLDFKNPNSDKTQWKTGDQMMEIYQSFIKVSISKIIK